MDLYDELPESELLLSSEFSSLLEASTQYCVPLADFITLNPKELSKILKRSINEIIKFQQTLTAELDKQFSEKNLPLSIANSPSPESFTTGDSGIDNLLGGGIFTHGITEIFGESSTGKTQLLMQLALSVQLPKEIGGLSAKSVYITTEGELATQRVDGMIKERLQFKKNGVSQNNIFTVNCIDLINQEHILNVQLPVLLEQQHGNIKLIIIDSISHHLRVELQSTSFRESQDNRYYIDKLAEKLLFLAKKHSLAIVVANQVSDKPLVQLNEPIQQEMPDYDYQLGWMVGWKNSSILYRQTLNEARANTMSSTERDHILSDDEESLLVHQEIQKVFGDQNKLEKSTDSEPSNIFKNSSSSSKLNNINKSIPFKRKVDSRVPNLGLSWANHVSTRLLLTKSYKASPMVTRGEVKYHKGNDISAFWQVKRTLKIAFSTYAPTGEIAYMISKNGFESL